MEETISTVQYTTRDLILYALGIGCSSSNGSSTSSSNVTDDYNELKYIYEHHPSFSAFPLFPLALSFTARPQPQPQPQPQPHIDDKDSTSKSYSYWGIQPFPPLSMQSHNNNPQLAKSFDKQNSNPCPRRGTAARRRRGGIGIGPLPSIFIVHKPTTEVEGDYECNQDFEEKAYMEDHEEDDDQRHNMFANPIIHISQSLTHHSSLPLPHHLKHLNGNSKGELDPPITLRLSTRVIQVIPKRIGTFVTTQTHYWWDPPPSPSSSSSSSSLKNKHKKNSILVCTAESCTLIMNLPPEKVLSFHDPTASSITHHPQTTRTLFDTHVTRTRNGNAKTTPTPPTWVDKIHTSPDQAILYRLSGDYNPLHVDSNLSAMALPPSSHPSQSQSQSQRKSQPPILHGLCTLGCAARAALKYCHVTFGGATETDQSRSQIQIQHMSAKFSSPVWVGAVLRVCLWNISNHHSHSSSSSSSHTAATTTTTTSANTNTNITQTILFQVWEDTTDTLVVDGGVLEVKVSSHTVSNSNGTSSSCSSSNPFLSSKL